MRVAFKYRLQPDGKGEVKEKNIRLMQSCGMDATLSGSRVTCVGGAVLQQTDFLKRHVHGPEGKKRPDAWLQDAMERCHVDSAWLQERLGKDKKVIANRKTTRTLKAKTQTVRRVMDMEQERAAAQTTEGRLRQEKRKGWQKPVAEKGRRRVRDSPPPELEYSSNDEDDEDDEDESSEASEEDSSVEEDTRRRSHRLRAKHQPNGS